MRKSGVIVESLFLTFAQQIFHSEAISYCFAIALFDPIPNKKKKPYAYAMISVFLVETKRIA